MVCEIFCTRIERARAGVQARGENWTKSSERFGFRWIQPALLLIHPGFLTI
jgi:hypothetical protein